MAKLVPFDETLFVIFLRTGGKFCISLKGEKCPNEYVSKNLHPEETIFDFSGTFINKLYFDQGKPRRNMIK